MKKLDEYKYVIIILMIVAGSFYWYEWRPTQIKKECFQFVVETEAGHAVANWGEAYDIYYKNCLRQRGL